MKNASFSYAERDANKDAYNNGEFVKLATSYHVYKKVHTDYVGWDEEDYNDGDSKDITYQYTTKTELDENSTATAGQYAIVGGTEYVYKSESWQEASTVTDDYDYSQMKFSYWKNTLEKAITSKYADNNIQSDIFQDCKNLTDVNFMAGNVTGFQATRHRMAMPRALSSR